MAETEPSLQVVLKVASRCNLNCSYCYVYNKGDDAWRLRPALMSEEVFDAGIERARRHCLRSRQRSLSIIFHGGEPCLLGVERFDQYCRRAKKALAEITRVCLVLQTNGTLLDDEWARVLKANQVNVAVSLDGPREVNDVFRVDHGGGGSHEAVMRGVDALRRAGIPLQILSVIQFGIDGCRVHRHFAQLGATTINYLFPDYTHDTIEEVRRRFGPMPCADYLIPVFDDWWSNSTLNLRIVLFWNIARLILGGECEVDLFGNKPFGFLFVEADGSIEGLDVLKICQPGITQTGLNVLRDDFSRLGETSPLHKATILDGVPLPRACTSCPEETTCAGGYLPHRFSSAHNFDNPSVWCADILALFEHIRKKLEVSTSETLLRRQLLRELAAEAGTQ